MKFDAALAQPGISGTSFSIPLSKGPANTKAYHIIVQESSSLSKSPDEWLPSQLGPYDASTSKTGQPYVTAILSSYMSKFVIGDGKEYKASSRIRRNVGSGTYKNVPLKPNTEYLVFQRAYVSQNVYYSSPWLGPIKTNPDKSSAQPSNESLGMTTTIVTINVAAFVFIVIIAVLAVIVISRRNSKQTSTTKSEKEFFPMNQPKGQKDSMVNKGYSNEEGTHSAEETFAETAAGMMYNEVNDGTNDYEENIHRSDTDGSDEKITSNSNSSCSADEAKAVPSPQLPDDNATTSSLLGINGH